ncbi:MAG: protein-disulfide reductase DsbD domain-containing protein, partial [Planctomycetota bacterium]
MAIFAVPAGAQGVDGLDPFGGFSRTAPPEELTAQATASHTQVKPGQEFTVAIELSVAENWVFYSPDANPQPGPKVIPARAVVETSDGLIAGEVLWPPDRLKVSGEGDYREAHNAYSDRAVLYVPVRVAEDAEPAPAEVRVTVTGQVCEDDGQCKDASVDPVAEVEIGQSAAANASWTDDLASGIAAAVPA